MLKKLMMTENDATATWLRLMLGLVLLPHALQKTLGLFGGGGISGTIDFFSQNLGIPAFLTLLVIAAEFLGSLGLIAGLLSRLAAAGITLNMLGAILLVHRANGFFMNWFGNQPGEGFEFHLLVIAIAVAVLVKGSGALSLDRKVLEKARV